MYDYDMRSPMVAHVPFDKSIMKIMSICAGTKRSPEQVSIITNTIHITAKAKTITLYIQQTMKK